jgi:hypothetical protein
LIIDINDRIIMLSRGPPAPRLRGPQASSVDQSNKHQSKYFLRAVGIGFLLGAFFTRYANLVLQTDEELKKYNALQELAASGLSLPSQDCQLSSTSKNEVTKTADTMKQDVSKLVGEMTDKSPKLAERKMDASILHSSVVNHAQVGVRNAADATTKREVIDFEHQERVVIAMKIHGAKSLTAVKQSLCLNKYAYNDRVNYDYLVFSSEPVNQTDIDAISAIVAPAKFTLVVDNPGMEAMVAELSPEQRDKLMKRCNVTSGDQLHWYTRCREGNTYERIAYSWQAEFRALHLWNHPALSQYRYMLWVDSDGFCTKKWEQDPIATLIRNNLAILFANFPQGRTKGPGFHERFMQAFNRSVCWVGIEDGHLYSKEGACAKSPSIPMIHGFMHVTDLDFYRSEPAMKWARALIGDEKFSRKYDDQIGITISSAVLAPNRSWLMSDHGIQLDVYHNAYLDGQKRSQVVGK